MRIAGVASEFPEYSYPQEVITAALKEHWGAKLERPGLIERLHSRAGVKRRYLAYPIERYAQFQNWGETNAAWVEAAQSLGARAIERALERAGLERCDLDALYIVSITGIASPSLDAKLINKMGLRPDLKRTPIFGLGCVGGAIGLVRAADYVRAFPNQTAAILSVELCSLTIQRDDISTVNLISSGLFGDGAVAAVLVGSERSRDEPAETLPEIISTRSVFYPGTEDIMGWDISEKGFSIVLSPKLPDLIRCHLAGDVDAFLRDNRLARGDIGNWVIHPGGPKILQAVESALGFGDRELGVSWDCLSQVGNLSSGSVLCVLEETIEHRRPAPGTMGLILAMGPGFCSELLLVRW